jgi:hypothetical protein
MSTHGRQLELEQENAKRLRNAKGFGTDSKGASLHVTLVYKVYFLVAILLAASLPLYHDAVGFFSDHMTFTQKEILEVSTH